MQNAKQGLKEAKKALGGGAKENPEKLDEGIQRSHSLGSAGKKEPEAEGQMRGHGKSNSLKSARNAESRDKLRKEDKAAAKKAKKEEKKRGKIAKKSPDKIDKKADKKRHKIVEGNEQIEDLEKRIKNLQDEEARQKLELDNETDEKKESKINKQIFDLEGEIRRLKGKKQSKEQDNTKLQTKIRRLDAVSTAKRNAPPPGKQERQEGDKEPKKKWSRLVHKVRIPEFLRRHKKEEDSHVTEDKGNGPSL